jgi:hypothetical protein
MTPGDESNVIRLQTRGRDIPPPDLSAGINVSRLLRQHETDIQVLREYILHLEEDVHNLRDVVSKLLRALREEGFSRE